MTPFSVAMSIYQNDNPQHVRVALDSMLVNQGIKPSDIVLVEDGPVSCELDQVVREYEGNYPGIITVVRLPINKGLGNALRIGVEMATYEIVARMDSDDICSSDRFEKQLSFLNEHQIVDVMGGQITEFVDAPANIVAKRIVPLDDESIYRYMKRRCGVNHMSVMFRKSAVLKVGNYQDFYCNEDYYLWVRMMIAGCRFANLPDVLVNVRSGKQQYSRRGGKRYFESNKSIQKLLLDNNFISTFEYYVNTFVFFIIQRVLPNSVRGWVYRSFAREKM